MFSDEKSGYPSNLLIMLLGFRDLNLLARFDGSLLDTLWVSGGPGALKYSILTPPSWGVGVVFSSLKKHLVACIHFIISPSWGNSCFEVLGEVELPGCGWNFWQIMAYLEKNWQVILVVFHSMIFPGSGAVPVHSRNIFKTTIQTVQGHI